MLERYEHGSLSIDFSQVVSRALKDGRDVELAFGEDSGIVLVVDGVTLPNERNGFPVESFTWPLEDVPLARGEPEALVDELVREIKDRRTRRRNKRASTDTHAAAEGIETE